MGQPRRAAVGARLMCAALNRGHLRRYAVARSLFGPTDLHDAVARFGFVQADPIRAPARAQDLTLRHRVRDYRAGDLERAYAALPIDEDYFVNYGFLPSEHLGLMRPRVAKRPWDDATVARAQAVLAFVAARGEAAPREVQAAFDHGTAVNAWGGRSNAVTHLLDAMHYRGLLRVARRRAGHRVYAPATATPDPRSDDAKADALVALVVGLYAPLTTRSVGLLVRHLGLGAPQLKGPLQRARARAVASLPSAVIDGERWLWPTEEDPASPRWQLDDALRLLAPFDPIVWDRARFAVLFGWEYRFEAYTPAARRKLGYYALPVLWRGEIRGWANLRVVDGRLDAQLGDVDGAPADPDFAVARDEELQRVAAFLGAAVG